MRLAPRFASLAALICATASAHEAGFNAVWVQPVAPMVARAAIVPIGWTHSLSPETDFVLEVTPYYAPGSGCTSPGCRTGLHGLILTGGFALGTTISTTGSLEFGWFLAPKALAAAAREAGTSGGPSTEPPFVAGTAYEFGAGLDFGLELHARRQGIYAALVIGWQATVLLNYAETDLGGAPPTWPVWLTHETSTGARGTSFTSGPNMNLLRIGFAI